MTEEMKIKVEDLVKKAEQLAKDCIYMTAGVNRNAWYKVWNEKRAYIKVTGRSLMGHVKGTYSLGYVDLETGEYVVTKYDDVNVLTGESMK